MLIYKTDQKKTAQISLARQPGLSSVLPEIVIFNELVRYLLL